GTPEVLVARHGRAAVDDAAHDRLCNEELLGAAGTPQQITKRVPPARPVGRTGESGASRGVVVEEMCNHRRELNRWTYG
ncbi:MAG: hypothetical protein Q8P50_04125, partial [Bacillota bacterium]|nr:hypothetical protein [Bacillota bacterium]